MSGGGRVLSPGFWKTIAESSRNRGAHSLLTLCFEHPNSNRHRDAQTMTARGMMEELLGQSSELLGQSSEPSMSIRELQFYRATLTNTSAAQARPRSASDSPELSRIRLLLGGEGVHDWVVLSCMILERTSG